MQVKPSGPELLEIALKVFKEELLIEIPEEKKYNGLMVANALAIVIRQLKTKTEDSCHDNKTLSSILEADGNLMYLSELLAKRIRNGDYKHNETKAAEIEKILLKITTSSVLQSNPKYLNK